MTVNGDTKREQIDMTIRLEVNISDLNGPSRLTVSSDDAGERFYDAWRRAWVAATGRTWEEQVGDQFDGEFVWQFEADGQPLFIHSEPNTTMGDMDAITEGGSVHLTLGWGLGGDDLILVISNVKQFVDAGLTIIGILTLVRQGRDVLDKRVFSRQRELFEDWRDTGAQSADLTYAVFARREWSMRDFCRTFGCSEDGASKLLLEMGYRAHRDPDTDVRTWRDPES